MNPPNYSVLLEIKRPVAVAELAAITDALIQFHGKDLLMRQEGPYLQICKPSGCQLRSAVASPLDARTLRHSNTAWSAKSLRAQSDLGIMPQVSCRLSENKAMNTTTPRTDDYYETRLGRYGPGYVSPANFAREMERENKRLRDIIHRASTKFCEDGADGIIAAAMFAILGEASKSNVNPQTHDANGNS